MHETPIETMEDPSIDSLITYPGEWWNEDDVESINYERRVRSRLPDADIIIISDTDTDGYGCMAILEIAYPDENIVKIPAGHSGEGVEFLEALSLVEENAPSGVPVYITDIKPDEEISKAGESLLRIGSEGRDIFVYDHHQWEDSIYNLFDKVATVDIRQEEDVCAADVLFDNIKQDIPEEEFEKVEELVDITRDHDIWIKEDKRSDILSDYSQIAEDMDEYVDTIRRYGGDLIANASDELSQKIQDHQEEKNKRIEAVVKQSTWYSIIIGENENVEIISEEGEATISSKLDEITVAVAYGNAYSSAIGDVLCRGWAEWHRIDQEERDSYEYSHMLDMEYESSNFRPGDADITIIIPPWNKVSFRSSEEYNICDLLASELGGGGHKKAAGCSPDYVGKNGITYGEHWETKGSIARAHLLMDLEEIIEDLLDSEDFRERLEKIE